MWLVVGLTAVMMVIEIIVGYATHSMALLADGWHMATHVGALGLSGAAYVFARRYAAHPAFSFGTGKVQALAGYTSALLLGLVALAMVAESVERLLTPLTIDFDKSLPVAVVGLVVNLASVLLLHVNDDHEGHGHSGHGHGGHGHGGSHARSAQDHNHRAALLHVVADTLTSALAIAALLAGRYLSWGWLDALSGIVGGFVILQWGVGLARHASQQLLDVNPRPELATELRNTLEQHHGVTVVDVHIWPLGGEALGCVLTLSGGETSPTPYREALARFGFAHLTVEMRAEDPTPRSDP